jgi:hypothetical protein
MYKLPMPIEGKTPNLIIRTADNAFIPFDPANNDYANFKAQIMVDEAELQDAEGVTMSPDAAKNFVKELP